MRKGLKIVDSNCLYIALVTIGGFCPPIQKEETSQYKLTGNQQLVR